MSHRVKLVAGVLAIAASTVVSGSARGPRSQVTETTDSLTMREFFVDTASLVGKAGQTKTVRVVVRQWVVNGGQKIAQLPQPGLLVVQLSAGTLATTIDGERRDRRLDEFWTVLPGSTMAVETGREQAVLEVVAITER